MGSPARRLLCWPSVRRIGGLEPSPVSRSTLTPALGVIGSAIAAVALAGAASRPEALLARAADVPVSTVLEATEIEMDGATVGVFGRYRLDGFAVAAVVSEPGGREARLGPANEVWFAGIVDLGADGGLTPGRRTPRRLRSAGLRRPALALVTRHEETIAPAATAGALGSRSAGTRRETRLYLIELVDGTMRRVLDLQTKHRSEDGFGGHDVGGLTLRQRDGRTYLEGVRQDRLPASRARCLEPEPYPVRFELAGHRFRELPVERRQPPCG